MRFKLGIVILIAASTVTAAALAHFKRADRARYKLEEFKRATDFSFENSDKYDKSKVDKMIEVGAMLFFDPRLSRSGLMSCATCHNPSFHWTDGLKTSVENLSKRSMSLYNIGWDRAFLWNGHSGSITVQVIKPLTAPLGMNSDSYLLWSRLRPIKYYRDAFDEIFGDERTDTINLFSVARVLDYYVSTIVSPRAPFDDWVDGDDVALTEDQKKGFELFTGKANCVKCHKTWRFTDSYMHHDIGRKFPDDGFAQEFAAEPFFKAVGLRNIADRPPYMHDGAFETLEDVVKFYNKGGDVERSQKSPFIKPLNLTDEEQRQLVLFLQSLSGTPEPITFPILPR